MKRPRHLKEILVTLICNLGPFRAGMSMGWASPMVPQLIANADGECVIAQCASEQSAAWMASLAFLGIICGPYMTGTLTNTIGRKSCLLIGTAFNLLSWFLLGLAQNGAMILTGRMLLGVSDGITTVAVIVYIGEIVSINIRGFALTSAQIFMSCSVVIMFVMGSYLPYRTVHFIIIAICIVEFALLFIVPESPCFLVMKGRDEDAAKVIRWLRDISDDEISSEIKAIKDSLANTPKASLNELVTTPFNRKVLAFLLSLHLFQALNGMTAVLFFANSIFHNAASSIHPDTATIILGVMHAMPNFVTPFIIDLTGRRKIYIPCYALLEITQTLLGLYFFVDDHSLVQSIDNFRFLPLVFLILSYWFHGLCSPITGALNAELFQDKVRGLGTTLTMTFGWLIGFLVTTAFGYAINSIGSYIIFWTFASSCFVNFFVTLFFMPETRGVTPDNVRQLFEKNKK